MKRLLGILIVLFLFLACSTTPTTPSKASVTFINLQRFDDNLSASLVGIKEPVSVDFYSPVSPNDIPLRMLKWLATVEKSVSRINISQPEGEIVPRYPMIVFSLFSGLWNGIKAVRSEYMNLNMENSMKNRDADISMALNGRGILYNQKIVFKLEEAQ
jgi:hypothetical protein